MLFGYHAIPAGYVARCLLFLKIKQKQIHHLCYHDELLYAVSELTGLFGTLKCNIPKLLQEIWLGAVRYLHIKKEKTTTCH